MPACTSEGRALVQLSTCRSGWCLSRTNQSLAGRSVVEVVQPRRRCRQPCKAKLAAKDVVPLVEAPPDDFDFRAATASTRDIVESQYPQLVDLVDTGIQHATGGATCSICPVSLQALNASIQQHIRSRTDQLEVIFRSSLCRCSCGSS